jgi:UPF0271 protein
VEVKQIDLNVDVGEGIGNESLLMPQISSCNIACGGHAGTAESMMHIVRLAKQHQVKIGAHPSFPDWDNFGRKVLDMSSSELYNSIRGQITGLLSIIEAETANLNHVKPHGALYNLAATNTKTASIIIDVLKSLTLPVKLYVPYGSVIADLAIKNNIKIAYEAFADRNYNNDLTLVSREKKDAVIYDEKLLFKHVFNMISVQKVKTIQGMEIEILADTFCIHGDNENVIDLIENLRIRLMEHNIKIS